MMKQNNKGHMLVILLFFMVLSVTVIAASVTLMILSAESTTIFVSGNQARSIAESGIDNAIIRLLRDPNYTGENNLAIGDGTVNITVTGSTTKVITATATQDNQIKKIEVGVQLINGVLTVSYWKEIT